MACPVQFQECEVSGGQSPSASLQLHDTSTVGISPVLHGVSVDRQRMWCDAPTSDGIDAMGSRAGVSTATSSRASHGDT